MATGTILNIDNIRWHLSPSPAKLSDAPQNITIPLIPGCGPLPVNPLQDRVSTIAESSMISTQTLTLVLGGIFFLLLLPIFIGRRPHETPIQIEHHVKFQEAIEITNAPLLQRIRTNEKLKSVLREAAKQNTQGQALVYLREWDIRLPISTFTDLMKQHGGSV